jgi:hypothetical protein
MASLLAYIDEDEEANFKAGRVLNHERVAIEALMARQDYADFFKKYLLIGGRPYHRHCAAQYRRATDGRESFNFKFSTTSKPARMPVSRRSGRSRDGGTGAIKARYIQRSYATEESAKNTNILGHPAVLTPDFWRVVEELEKRSDARVQSQIIADLPYDARIGAHGRRAIVAEFSRIFDTLNLPWMAAIHTPKGNPNNFHVHLLFHDRPLLQVPADEIMEGKGREGSKLKTLIIDSEGKAYAFFSHKSETARRRDFISSLRQRYTDIVNKSFVKNHIDRQWDHRSFRARGLDRIPTLALGMKASALENAGVLTRRGEKNAAISNLNIWREAHTAASEAVNSDRSTYEKSTATFENVAAAMSSLELRIHQNDESPPDTALATLLAKLSDKIQYYGQSLMKHPDNIKSYAKAHRDTEVLDRASKHYPLGLSRYARLLRDCLHMAMLHENHAGYDILELKEHVRIAIEVDENITLAEEKRQSELYMHKQKCSNSLTKGRYDIDQLMMTAPIFEKLINFFELELSARAQLCEAARQVKSCRALLAENALRERYAFEREMQQAEVVQKESIIKKYNSKRSERSVPVVISTHLLNCLKRISEEERKMTILWSHIRADKIKLAPYNEFYRSDLFLLLRQHALENLKSLRKITHAKSDRICASRLGLASGITLPGAILAVRQGRPTLPGLRSKVPDIVGSGSLAAIEVLKWQHIASEYVIQESSAISLANISLDIDRCGFALNAAFRQKAIATALINNEQVAAFHLEASDVTMSPQTLYLSAMRLCNGATDLVQQQAMIDLAAELLILHNRRWHLNIIKKRLEIRMHHLGGKKQHLDIDVVVLCPTKAGLPWIKAKIEAHRPAATQTDWHLRNFEQAATFIEHDMNLPLQDIMKYVSGNRLNQLQFLQEKSLFIEVIKTDIFQFRGLTHETSKTIHSEVTNDVSQVPEGGDLSNAENIRSHQKPLEPIHTSAQVEKNKPVHMSTAVVSRSGGRGR